MELETVKKYLRVDEDYDDDYIQLLVDTAIEYIISAVGRYDENKARAKLVLLNIVATLYENRQFTIEKAKEEVQYTLKSMLRQLQLETETENGD